LFTDFLLDVCRRNADRDAIVWRSRVYTYAQLLTEIDTANRDLDAAGVRRSEIVSIEADFSPRSVAMMLALIERGSCVVPLTASVENKKAEFRRIAQIERTVTIDDSDRVRVERTGARVDHPILLKVKDSGNPSLILFSSGSTGASKAAVHDFVPLLEKFKVPRNSKRMITFLLFDHIGGVNTLFYALSNGGCIVTVEERTPAAVGRAIQDFKVQILPTSPTFLNLLLLSEAYRQYDFSSLELFTYGTEPMPENTLKRTHELFPGVTLQQTYGLSELGIMRSKSKSSDSLWVKIGGEGFETRVVDGLLEIKAKSAMLGYLNAESPFTADGWFKTGDQVEVDGEYMRILGRRSEMINVGGEKVYPAEVESVISEMPEIADVVVTGEPNAIMGTIVKATVRLKPGVATEGFKQKLQGFCKGKLAGFKVPQRVVVQQEQLHSDRFKKLRATF
jgi:acyl-coenzyme A synthetase/AMP-(fatty) acid ligase